MSTCPISHRVLPSGYAPGRRSSGARSRLLGRLDEALQGRIKLRRSWQGDTEGVFQNGADLRSGGERAPLGVAVQMMDSQLVVAQRIAAICIWPGYHQPGGEVRMWVIGEIPARHLIVGQELLLEIEAVE